MTKPRRFCMLTTFYPPCNFGGDGMGVRRLARALVRAGHEVSVVHDVNAYRVLGGRETPSPGIGEDGVEILPLESGLGFLSPLLTQQTGRPIVQRRRLRAILDRGFDVINYHNVSLVGGPGILSLGEGVKIYTAHEHWLVCPTHVLWRHGREPCDARECLRCVLRHRRPPQAWRYTGFLRRQLAHVDAFIAKSEFSRAKHREFGFPRDMEVMPYFLPDREPVDAAPEAEAPHDRPYFLFVGRLEKIKGLQDVIPAFRGVPGADLLVAGAGEHGEALRRQASDAEGVRFLGRVDPARLRAYYRHALALIVPSVCYETFGIILIEALREGTPVIARRIGPFPEIVARCGEAGRLFDDTAELVRALRSVPTEGAERERVRTVARRAFDVNWSEGAVLPQYLDIVRRAGGRARPRAVTDLNVERMA
ncbi:MAG: glycosyltransferase family 4 protein [Gemmatimonadota bacterium]